MRHVIINDVNHYVDNLHHLNFDDFKKEVKHNYPHGKEGNEQMQEAFKLIKAKHKEAEPEVDEQIDVQPDQTQPQG